MSSSGPASSAYRNAGDGCHDSGGRAEHADLDERRRPDHAVVERGLDGLDAGAEERVRRTADEHAGGGGRVEHLAAALDAGGQRLLGVDVLAGGDRLQRDVGVQVRRREVQDDVDVVAGEQLVRRARLRPCSARALGAASGSTSAQATKRSASSRGPFGRYCALTLPQPISPTPSVGHGSASAQRRERAARRRRPGRSDGLSSSTTIRSRPPRRGRRRSPASRARRRRRSRPPTYRRPSGARPWRARAGSGRRARRASATGSRPGDAQPADVRLEVQARRRRCGSTGRCRRRACGTRSRGCGRRSRARRRSRPRTPRRSARPARRPPRRSPAAGTHGTTTVSIAERPRLLEHGAPARPRTRSSGTCAGARLQAGGVEGGAHRRRPCGRRGRRARPLRRPPRRARRASLEVLARAVASV